MLENDANTSPSQNDEYDTSFTEYLKRAAWACSKGDAVLGMHLYLAAFERAQNADNPVPNEAALEGLKQAWRLACTLKERSIAEYVFERLEPYLSSEEAAMCAAQLQDLALDKLEEFGLSREDLEDMTDMISQDFLGIDAAHLLRVEHITTKTEHGEPVSNASDCAAQVSLKEPEDTSVQNEVLNGEVIAAHTEADAKVDHSLSTPEEVASASIEAQAQESLSSIERISYKELVGYNDTVTLMRDFGVGMQEDVRFQELVEQLNARHGLDRMPAADALLFRSPAREDANRFMAATLGELNLPALRMHMEENLQGMPVLCVMAQADNQPKLNAARNAFEGAGVLMLEDLDLWVAPLTESATDELGGFLFASLSRGAREAISLIRSAVENPDVFVLASSAEGGETDPFFFDLLEPLSVVDIDYPTESERADIWMEIAHMHPSVRGMDRDALVGFSAQMARYDIYMAAREAVEEAYKASLVARRYVPVTTDNLFDKLAAYQPLDSAEYQALEDAVVTDFRQDLEHLEDLLKGEEG